MNSLIDTSFCTTINSSHKAATDIVDYLTYLGRSKYGYNKCSI